MKPLRVPDQILHNGKIQPNALRDHLYQLNKIVGGRLTYGTGVPDPVNPGRTVISNNEPDRNIQCWKATGTSPGVADTDFTISHSLGYIPTTIIGQDTTNGGLIYRSPGPAWTATTVTLRCNKANAQYIVILA